MGYNIVLFSYCSKANLGTCNLVFQRNLFYLYIMERRVFLKRFIKIAGVVAVVPTVIAVIPKPVPAPYKLGTIVTKGRGVGMMKHISHRRPYIIYTGIKGMEEFHRAIKEYTRAQGLTNSIKLFEQ